MELPVVFPLQVTNYTVHKNNNVSNFFSQFIEARSEAFVCTCLFDHGQNFPQPFSKFPA